MLPPAAYPRQQNGPSPHDTFVDSRDNSGLMLDQLGALSPAFALVLFLGSSVMYLASARGKSTISTLEKDNDALGKRVANLEAADARKDAEILALQTANDVLTKTVNSGALIAANHAETMTILREIKAVLE